MKYKALILATALALTALLSACSDRMTARDSVEPDSNRAVTTVLPKATATPKATAKPASTPKPTDARTEGDSMLEDAEKDIERTTEQVKDELSDGDGIVN